MAGSNQMDPANYEAWPLDILLLKILPDEGLIGGVHWQGRRVKDLAAEEPFKSNGVLTSQISARLRVMHMVGLATVKPASGGKVWSRTKEWRKQATHVGISVAAIEPTERAPDPEPEQRDESNQYADLGRHEGGEQ